jgi:hypothetical protein
MTPTEQLAPETTGKKHSTSPFPVTAVLDPEPSAYPPRGIWCSLGLSMFGDGEHLRSRPEALIRTMTADQRFLAYRPAPRFR